MAKSTMFKVQTPYGEFKRESQSKAYQFAIIVCGRRRTHWADEEIARIEGYIKRDKAELAAALASPTGLSPDREYNVYYFQGERHAAIAEGKDAAYWQSCVEANERQLQATIERHAEAARDSEQDQREHKGAAYGWSQSVKGAVAMAKKATSEGWIVVGLAPVDPEVGGLARATAGVSGYAMLTARTMLPSESVRIFEAQRKHGLPA